MAAGGRHLYFAGRDGRRELRGQGRREGEDEDNHHAHGREYGTRIRRPALRIADSILLAQIDQVFTRPSITLGEAVLGAKAAVSDIDVRRTWILFGDPTMRVR